MSYSIVPPNRVSKVLRLNLRYKKYHKFSIKNAIHGAMKDNIILQGYSILLYCCRTTFFSVILEYSGILSEKKFIFQVDLFIFSSFTDIKMMTLDINTSLPAYSNNLSHVNMELLLEEINAQEVKVLYPVIFFYAIILSIGVVGNFLVLLVYSARYKRSPARIYILFLAAIDFSICLFGLPYHLIDLTHPYTFTNSTACKSLTFIVTTLFHMSIFGLIVIAVDRYLKICRPLGKLQISYFGRRRACAAAVVAAIALSWPQIVLYGPSEMETKIDNVTGYACFIETSYFETKYPFIYIMCTLVICVGSTVFLVLAYSFICRQIYLRYKHNLLQIKTTGNGLDEASLTEEVSLKSFTVQNGGNRSSSASPLARSLESVFKKTESNLSNKVIEHNNSKVNIYINSNDQLNGENEDDIDVVDSCNKSKSNKIEAHTEEERYELLPSKSDGNIDDGIDHLSVTRQRSFSLDSYEFKTPLKPEDTYVHVGDKDRYLAKANKYDGPENMDETDKNNTEVDHDLEKNGMKNISSQSLSKSSNSSSTKDLCLNDSLTKCSEQANKEQKNGNRLEIPRNHSNNVADKKDVFKRRYSEQIGNKIWAVNKNLRSGSMGVGSLIQTTHYGEGLRIHTCNVSSNSLAGSSQSTMKPKRLLSRKHSKITKIMLTITSVFVLSYAPALVISIYSFVQPDLWDIMSIEETVVCEFFLRFYLVNNICNPFIYGFWDKRFKHEIVITLKKIFRFRGSCKKCYDRVSLT